MAKKISVINVKGVPYEINLSTTAAPKISSLTVTGNLNVEGTSNLASINCESSLLIKALSNCIISTASVAVQIPGYGKTVDIKSGKLYTRHLSPLDSSSYNVGAPSTRYNKGYFDYLDVANTLTTNLIEVSYIRSNSSDGLITFEGDLVTNGSNAHDLGSRNSLWRGVYASILYPNYIGSNLVPENNNSLNIGSSTYSWKNLYVKYINGAQLDWDCSINGNGMLCYMGSSAYSSYGDAMSTTDTTHYIEGCYYRLDATDATNNRGYSQLTIKYGTFVKSSGDNTGKTITFSGSAFVYPPIVIMQAGSGNAPQLTQYRNTNTVGQITTTGFLCSSGCSEETRMCYIAIGF